MSVTVAGSDITDLTVTLPTLILGHATVEGGGALPRQVSGGTVLPAVLQLDVARVGGGTLRNIVTPRGDGPFLLPIPTPGDYWLRPIVLPIGYELKSMTFGNLDLMKQPLAVALPLTAETVEIVLAKPKTSGVHVSGQVKDIPAPTGNLIPIRRASLATIRTATNPQTGKLADTQYFAEVLLNADGSFDLQGITPGRYILQAPGVVLPVEVATNDINRLEFSVGGPSTPVLATNLLFKLQSAFPVSPPAAPNNAATLVVTESGIGPAYIEGAWGYLRVTSSDDLIDEKRIERTGASISLAPGSYELIAYSRSCNGNCSNPDAPRDECRLPVTLAAGETLTLDRVLADATCTLRITSRR
jgi:hypothetical protein